MVYFILSAARIYKGGLRVGILNVYMLEKPKRKENKQKAKLTKPSPN